MNRILTCAPLGFTANARANTVTMTLTPVAALVSVSETDEKAKKQDEVDEEVDESQVGIGSIVAGVDYDKPVGAFLAGGVL